MLTAILGRKHAGCCQNASPLQTDSTAPNTASVPNVAVMPIARPGDQTKSGQEVLAARESVRPWRVHGRTNALLGLVDQWLT